MYYLTNKSSIDGVMVKILPLDVLARDTNDSSLVSGGWAYGEFCKTGVRVLVKSKGNRRWLNAWNAFVTDFEVCEVGQVVDQDGAIWAAKGEKRKSYKLYTKTSNLGC